MSQYGAVRSVAVEQMARDLDCDLSVCLIPRHSPDLGHVLATTASCVDLSDIEVAIGAYDRIVASASADISLAGRCAPDIRAGVISNCQVPGD